MDIQTREYRYSSYMAMKIRNIKIMEIIIRQQMQKKQIIMEEEVYKHNF